MGRGQHGPRAAWAAGSMGRGQHGPRAAWARAAWAVGSMGRGQHGPWAAWAACGVGGGENAGRCGTRLSYVAGARGRGAQVIGWPSSPGAHQVCILTRLLLHPSRQVPCCNLLCPQSVAFVPPNSSCCSGSVVVCMPHLTCRNHATHKRPTVQVPTGRQEHMVADAVRTGRIHIGRIVRGIAELHCQGVVHGDELSAFNVLMASLPPSQDSNVQVLGGYRLR